MLYIDQRAKYKMQINEFKYDFINTVLSKRPKTYSKLSFIKKKRRRVEEGDSLRI